MAKNHPKGLVVLALTNMGERFGYYTMLAILTLYLQAKFGFSSSTTSLIYGSFLALVYFLPLFGGVVADKWLGYGRTILIGVLVMFGGYLLLSLPMGTESVGIFVMTLALILIAAGTGLFKGNLQALVGKLYDDPRYTKNRDMAFSIFYMFINIGAFFAPSMGQFITNSQLKGQGFHYDASIPANFVALNDDQVDKEAFIAEYATQHEGFYALSEKEQQEAIDKAKKKHGVIFQEDVDKHLFNLKLAGMRQYSASKMISQEANPEWYISEEEYRVMSDRTASEAVKAEQALVREKVMLAEITDPRFTTLADDVEINEKHAAYKDTFAFIFASNYVTSNLSVSYSWAFVVACISLVISILVFVIFRKTWKGSDMTVKQAQAAAAASGGNANIPTMSKEEIRERMIALLLVFMVVIFFWMAFHQNGLTLTFFARDYTENQVSPGMYSFFALYTLIPFVVFMYGIYLATFGLLGGKRRPGLGLALTAVGIIGLGLAYFFGIGRLEGLQQITPQIFQQFNPLFIILLTPVTVGLFAALARRGKEPSAPRKIGYGMVLAAVGFVVLLVCALLFDLPDPASIQGRSNVLVSPGWLIGTYGVLTVAELFLSPMGLSFVSKVSPPQYAGLMQGGWLAASAVGNFLVGVMGSLWDKMPMAAFWGVLIACCLLSALFIFSVMKRLERATGDTPKKA